MSKFSKSQTARDAQHDAGLSTRRQVLGDAYVQGALDKVTPFTAELQEFVSRNAWGTVWQRDGLSLRDRSLITVSMAAALGRSTELKVHVRGALNNGVTPDELKEVLLHMSVYCGFPLTLEAFRAAAEVIDAQD